MRLLLLAFALLAAPAFAQSDPEPLRPGDVDVSTAEPYEQSYRIFVKQGTGGGMPFGTYTQSFSFEDGVALSVAHVNSAQGVQLDSTWFAWPSLEPIRHYSSAGGTVEEFEFDGFSISGTLREGGAFDAMLEESVFGPGAGEFIARTLPLEEGATTTYVSFDNDVEGNVDTTLVTVGGTQEMLGRTARVFTAADAEDSRTFYYDEQTREMLGFDIVPQPGILVEIRRSDLE